MLSRRHFLAASIGSCLTIPLSRALGQASVPILIDSHVHVFKHDPAFPFAAGAHPPAQDASAEMLLELMKANNVSRTVLIQVIHYRWDNRYVADVLRRYPKLFKGVCRVNPEDPAAPDQLARLTEEQGFHGVRLSPAAGAAGDWIRGPLMPPLWRRCAQLKVPMTLLLPVSRLADIHPLIEANPDLQVVIDHMADSPVAHPEELDALLALARYPKVFVKISHLWSVSKQPYPYTDTKEQVQRLHASFTAKRLMWGTDWPVSLPYLQYAQAVALFRDHLEYLPRADHEQILYKTVQEIWPFGLNIQGLRGETALALLLCSPDPGLAPQFTRIQGLRGETALALFHPSKLCLPGTPACSARPIQGSLRNSPEFKGFAVKPLSPSPPLQALVAGDPGLLCSPDPGLAPQFTLSLTSIFHDTMESLESLCAAFLKGKAA